MLKKIDKINENMIIDSSIETNYNEKENTIDISIKVINQINSQVLLEWNLKYAVLENFDPKKYGEMLERSIYENVIFS